MYLNVKTLSASEVLKLGNADQIADKLEQIVEEEATISAVINKLKRDLGGCNDELSQARCLLVGLQEALGDSKSLREFRKRFDSMLENSYFEL